MPWPSDVAPSGVEPVDGRQHVGLDVGRLLGDEAAVAEGDDADLDRAPAACSTNGAAAALAASMRVGFEVLGPHAVRHVEGEDHGALAVRAGRRSPAGRAKADEQQHERRRGRSANGTWRSRRQPPGRGGRHEALRGQLGRALAPAGARAPRSPRRAAARPAAARACRGQRNDISAAASAGARRCARSARDEVVLGRHLVEVDAGPPGGRLQLGLPRRRPARGSGGGTRGRSCRRTAAHRSRRPRRRSRRRRAARARAGRRGGSPPARGAGSAAAAAAPSPAR